MAKAPKLVVHIGHGKTGSSAIQTALDSSRAQLERGGVRYLGVMFEHAKTGQRHPWQKRTGSEDFFASTDTDARSGELFDILSAELDAAARQNLTCLIASNEYFVQRPAFIVPALRKLIDLGAEVEVQCYVRRHDSWAQSAYVQWGIKHKTYDGPVLSFSDWAEHINLRKVLKFSDDLAPWLDLAGDRLKVFNYDAHPDTIAHFCTVNGLKDVATSRANESPSVEEILAWAAFNSHYGAPVLPVQFETLLRDAHRSSLPDLSGILSGAIMPTSKDLQAVVADSAADVTRLEALLAASGEPPLSGKGQIRPYDRPDPSVLSLLLARLISVQQGYLDALGQDVPGASAALARQSRRPVAQVANAASDVAAIPPQLARAERELAAARARPFRNLRDYMRFHALRGIARVIGSVAPAASASLGRSAAKRDPHRGLPTDVQP